MKLKEESELKIIFVVSKIVVEYSASNKFPSFVCCFYNLPTEDIGIYKIFLLLKKTKLITLIVVTKIDMFDWEKK